MGFVLPGFFLRIPFFIYKKYPAGFGVVRLGRKSWAFLGFKICTLFDAKVKIPGCFTTTWNANKYKNKLIKP